MDYSNVIFDREIVQQSLNAPLLGKQNAQRRKEVVKKVADTLCILTCFSLRTHFYLKAMRYANAGYEIFPSDIRFVELFAYCLVLAEDYEKAEAVLSKETRATWNTQFLKCRTAIMLDMHQGEKKIRISDYLNFSKPL